MAVKKLIEVALPLEAINSASAYEKMPGIGPHPRGLHLWWARRPLATARAVIWASLVDDPSSHPELFPTEEDQTRERERLFRILEDLSQWRNSNDAKVLEQAKAEIAKYMGDSLPPLLDPFAGGGAIPLEAQRLGLEAYAQDLNPIAVTINKSMIEIPPRFNGNTAVNPDSQIRKSLDTWSGNNGLVADVRYYGQWMLQQARKSIGSLYPEVEIPQRLGGGKTSVISWIWTRTVKCPNPACGCETPLVRSFDLVKKKGRASHVVCESIDGKLRFSVHDGKSAASGTVNRKGATCIACGSNIDFPYIREEGRSHRMRNRLMAIVAEGRRGRLYLSPNEEHLRVSNVDKPDDFPDAKIANNPRDFKTPNYGLEYFSDLFTNRQLVAMTTFCELVAEAQEKAYRDALEAGMADDGIGLNDGGRGALAYGQAVGVYLAFAVDRLADFSNGLTRWAATNEKSMNLFSKQAIAMTWDYPEVNVLGDSVGSFATVLDYVASCIETLPDVTTPGSAIQWDAQQDNGKRGIIVSTDPPYYDNIGYADLSDFFYIWLRRSLKRTYPELFGTMLVPKADELVATPYRDNRGVDGARDFFEEGMFKAVRAMYEYACDDVPVTIYYAFKQTETETVNAVEASSSTGWETMLSAIIRAGFSITGTWPARTEQSYRTI